MAHKKFFTVIRFFLEHKNQTSPPKCDLLPSRDIPDQFIFYFLVDFPGVVIIERFVATTDTRLLVSYRVSCTVTGE
ncbi:MAG: hypothetical protein OJF59_000184 [Cytophagales bacterium]|jgi:hypothetical protein|nr:hypothetical protein [Bacteroidota bacterium]MBS1982096.1 hypothetical protein [Bacteroidota bacterium]WHZ06431.1 MAG: hypothetical protein OJF59_000184 [Cytophagales bacterium]